MSNTINPLQKAKNKEAVKALRLSWNIKKSTIQRIVNYFNSYDYANDYLDIMVSITETDKPEEAWNDYLESMRGFVSMEEENPFINKD